MKQEHQLDVAEHAANILQQERWQEYASEVGKRGKKSLDIAVGGLMFRVKMREVEIYLGANVASAIEAYNTAFETAKDSK